MQKHSGDEKRKRKPLQKATLVYSVKTGQHQCGTYAREAQMNTHNIWKRA
ncbi:hypothetical protein [Flaviaesturariibacter aridisoli]|nr:hypothetical protein [Flaviaesturariibacter aridisoli]